VNLEQHSPAGDDPRFHTTRWSAVLLSAQSRAPGSQSALADLCRIYWYPIYAFVRRRGSSPEDAQDLTQSFFLHLLEHKALRQVSPVKGKFRSFLLASLQNYLSDQADSVRCLKRGGKTEFVPLDMKSAEERYRLAPLVFLTTFETLKPYIDPINSKAAFSYQDVANTLGVSLGSVRKLIFRLRKRYASILREEVARTISDPGEVDWEIQALCEALIAAEGRLGP
jgi:DNA-directed RNA polymerase specialized sigma24 family protein